MPLALSPPPYLRHAGSTSLRGIAYRQPVALQGATRSLRGLLADRRTAFSTLEPLSSLARTVPEPVFQSRSEAGCELAARLGHLSTEDIVVLGLPRGGVMVSTEVARHFNAPLEVWVSEKLRLPGRDDVFGFVSEDGDLEVEEAVVERLRIPPSMLVGQTMTCREQVRFRAKLYRLGRPSMNLEGKTVIVIDEGVATGATLRAALQALARHRPARSIVAIPIAPSGVAQKLGAFGGEVITLATPKGFSSIRDYYAEYPRVSDEDVSHALGAFTVCR